MDELITASQYAKATDRAPRTVQGWVEDKEHKPRPVPGVYRIGKAFAATRETWERIASSKKGSGRRDHEPRGSKKEPPAPS